VSFVVVIRVICVCVVGDDHCLNLCIVHTSHSTEFFFRLFSECRTFFSLLIFCT